MTRPRPTPVLLGRGRSAIVWRDVDDAGAPIARKVFRPDPAGRAVFETLYGAPNPYGWSPDAVEAALARRRILERLVPLWFPGRLRLPVTHGIRWNDEAHAFELRTEYVRGRHAPLLGPAGLPSPDALTDLVDGIMRPLQAHLEAAGFDGLVWQAGRGNPVAASNFLLTTRDGETPRWVWIDLESGVPALFSLDPEAQIRFYLPKALRQRRPLFDDVDCRRLRRALRDHEGALETRYGPGAYAALREEADRLEHHQRRWTSLNRLERGLLSAVAKGRMTSAEAQAWRRRPAAWYRHLARRVAGGALRRTRDAARAALRSARAFPYGTLARGVGRFVTSQRYRALLSRRLVAGRIRLWRERGSLTAAQARELHRELKRDEVSTWITDFGVHLMVKPFVKILQYVVLPVLLLAGVASGAATAVLLVAGGSIVRTLYTGGRLLQASAQGRRRPWIALAVGTLPVLGNTAYPLQFVSSSIGERGVLARFLLYESFALLGRRIPIWGGMDTLTEHRLNRLPARVFERREFAVRRRPATRGTRRKVAGEALT